MSQWKESEFCWTEIGVHDIAKARKFYTDVFGWDYTEVPMGPMGTYLMWKVGGQEIGGMYEQSEDMKKNMPSFWMNYIHTNSADDFAKRTKDAGGNVMQDPFDVYDKGRMAIIGDPSGAQFACWQPAQNQKPDLPEGTHGKVAWRELVSNDVEKAGKFYCDVVPGWGIEAQDMGPFKYHLFKDGDSMEAGMMAVQKEWGDMPSCWVTYVNVDDCDDSVAKIKAAGGNMIMPEPKTVPGVGRFTWATDNQGAMFAVISGDNS